MIDFNCGLLLAEWLLGVVSTVPETDGLVEGINSGLLFSLVCSWLVVCVSVCIQIVQQYNEPLWKTSVVLPLPLHWRWSCISVEFGFTSQSLSYMHTQLVYPHGS